MKLSKFMKFPVHKLDDEDYGAPPAAKRPMPSPTS